MLNAPCSKRLGKEDRKKLRNSPFRSRKKRRRVGKTAEDSACDLREWIGILSHCLMKMNGSLGDTILDDCFFIALTLQHETKKRSHEVRSYEEQKTSRLGHADE